MSLDYDEDAEPLVNIATGLHRIASALYELGHGKSQPTAIELIAIQLKDTVGPALEHIASTIEDHG